MAERRSVYNQVTELTNRIKQQARQALKARHVVNAWADGRVRDRGTVSVHGLWTTRSCALGPDPPSTDPLCSSPVPPQPTVHFRTASDLRRDQLSTVSTLPANDY